MNAKEILPLRITCEELGHIQPATPIRTDNNTAEGIMNGTINRIPAIVPLAALNFGVYFSEGHISLKKWTYCPLLRESATPFKSTCLLIK